MSIYIHPYSLNYISFSFRKENKNFIVTFNNKEYCWGYKSFPPPTVDGLCIVPEGVTPFTNSCFYN